MRDFYDQIILDEEGATPDEIKSAMVKVAKQLDPKKERPAPTIFVGVQLDTPLEDAYGGVTTQWIKLCLDPDVPTWKGDVEKAGEYLKNYTRLLAQYIRPNKLGRFLSWLGV